MSEDDTFRVLSRDPYDEVFHKLALMFSIREMNDGEIVLFLDRHGWMLEEFNNELNKRVQIT